MPVLPYLQFAPSLGHDVSIASTATVVGKVSIVGPARIEDGGVLRGDQNHIEVGPRFKMGRGSTVHVEFHTPTLIGADVWLGEAVVIHACMLGDGVRVEDGGLVLSSSSVGAGSIVAADALVAEGVAFPEHSYIAGAPGRRIRDTTADERAETIARVARALSL